MQVFKLARIKKYNSLPCILHGMLRRLGLILYPLICFGRAISSYSVFKVKCIYASATNTVQTQGLYVLSKQSTQAQHIYLSIKLGTAYYRVEYIMSSSVSIILYTHAFILSISCLLCSS